MDFHIQISGIHDDAQAVLAKAKEFLLELEAMGVTLETHIFGSGHLLGGSVDIKDEETPVNFAEK